MTEILFLAHRIPYPPNKGDKIRSWNLLRGLAERHTVHLGTFVDDPDDWQHVDALKRVCGEVCVRPLEPRRARLRSVGGLAAGRALSIDFYRDRTLSGWVADLCATRSLDGVFVYSSSMAQYAEDLALPAGVPRVIDFCDVDSDKWAQYSRGHRWPMSWVYGREARLLAEAERRYAGAFDATIVIAEPEAEILRALAPAARPRIAVVPNGVDTGYFDPSRAWPDPFARGSKPLVFTGAMDYHPNVDGVAWFAREALPAIRSHCPAATFWIVGSNPSAEVRSLGDLDGVHVTGRVPDVRPYLAHAAVVVAPLRIARGVQNKVLEGLAMARPVVVTPNAVQGIAGVGPAEVAVAGDIAALVEAVVAVLDRAPASVAAAREFVLRHYGWEAQVAALDRLLGAAARPC
ncbi:MAG: TIGR03087 family PEP-CTERM/XrtA system glycosyltransferase [Lysobacterales bacterium]|nr:MAG: TIGR03087 family PEP-CTERM/XrtA system glycosyltransferase [Xanthomonadales bacterium]